MTGEDTGAGMTEAGMMAAAMGVVTGAVAETKRVS